MHGMHITVKKRRMMHQEEQINILNIFATDSEPTWTMARAYDAE